MKQYKTWTELKKETLTPERIDKSRKRAEVEILKMNLRELRKLVGKTQIEVSQAAKMTQGELSLMEQREDHLISTMRRIITALGGELEIIARFGDKCIKLHGV